MTVKIGDVLFGNRGGKTWRGVIDGETPKSWLVNMGRWDQAKVNKKTLQSRGDRGFGAEQWRTEAEHLANKWLQANRYKISKAVDACQDVETLKGIALLLGYEEASS